MKAGLVVLLALLLVGCTPPAVESGLASSPELASRTTELAPGDHGDDEAALVAVFAVMGRSVGDMSTMGVAEFARVHGRGPYDQASLIGGWLGLASVTLAGPTMAGQIRRAASRPPLAYELSAEDGPAELIEDLSTRLAAAAPNEPSDNPRNPNAASLRVGLQTGFVSGRGR